MNLLNAHKLIPLLFYICLLLLSFPLLVVGSPFMVSSEGLKLKVELVAEGLGIPWGLAFISENTLLVTERSGLVSLLYLDKGIKIALKNMPRVMVVGQGGMLDVALSPDYKKTGWIYFTYVKEVNGEGTTVLARSKISNDKFTQWQELLVSRSATDTGYHFGSRIAFDGEAHVFFSIGDRGERPNGQDLTNHAGSIIRLNLDGSIPEDNPFVKVKGALPEIWSYGHRNSQGLAYDFVNKRLWSIEHGPRGGDEINLILKGENYGWPIISHGKEYWGPVSVGEGTHRKGMQDPVKVYIPSIAPGSLIIYNGNALPAWKGNLLSGALKLRHINRVVIDKAGKEVKEERLFKSMNERIRALTQSSEGWIYFSTDSGKIYRVRPTL
ncbi:PQQ-dependent oxidoreductase, gdhB family [hydrothermal vent metagenome]|uniref:PQQ-dependent oxidoreductase, gdhB family n=1 Tax=hydrothermal vent metagenome TaxID=652676 RepID=A0A3B1AJ09_9ZZZZ